jgi:uncharacterized protein (TIGR02391 family)
MASAESKTGERNMAADRFEEAVLREICTILADTNTGLTGTEIGRLLQGLRIEDVSPGITKRDRLFDALSSRQSDDKSGNNVVAFIHAAMKPVRWIKAPALFQDKRAELNVALAFAGLRLRDDGKLARSRNATTLSEAQQRADRLRHHLLERQVHGDVIRHCRAELLAENYFHAVFEATKSVAEKIRQRTGLTSDGAELVDEALGLRAPRLAVNSLRRETEESEQKGIAALLRGMFGTFRNVTAHAPKVTWQINRPTRSIS